MKPLEALKMRAGEFVKSSSIGNLGWAVIRARASNVLPTEAKLHLAHLYQGASIYNVQLEGEG